MPRKVTVKRAAKKAPAKRVPSKTKEKAQEEESNQSEEVVESLEGFTHIDRSTGKPMTESDLNPEKPHISPFSGQATVEKMTDDEMEVYNNQ